MDTARADAALQDFVRALGLDCDPLDVLELMAAGVDLLDPPAELTEPADRLTRALYELHDRLRESAPPAFPTLAHLIDISARYPD